MILQITDTNTGTKKFFAGIYRDGSVCWSTHEHVALDKRLIDLQAVATLYTPDSYVIRERIAQLPLCMFKWSDNSGKPVWVLNLNSI